MELEEYRILINSIDREIQRLFEQRMRAVAGIAEEKKKRGLPVFDGGREAELLRRTVERADPETGAYSVDLQKQLMRLSRAYQEEKLSPGFGGRLLKIHFAGSVCDVLVGRGTLASVGSFFDLRRKVLVVTDDGVPAIYAKTVADACLNAEIVTLPQGEATKCAGQLTALLGKMKDFGLCRGDCVVAVGGGVVGDLTGLAAALWMRGVEFYSVPTTLLSQLDSSIGGKTAIDFAGVKNSVGVIRQPKKVLIDPDVLLTLPPRQLANGMAEAIKVALTSDPALFEIFERKEQNEKIGEVILRALTVKKNVVEADENERGIRRILNFGHTLGHGIEATSDLCHGECVALGMLPMCAPELRERVKKIFRGVGLPTEYTGDTEAAIALASYDKKRDGDGLFVVTVDEIGKGEIRRMPVSEWAERVRRK